MEWYLYLFLLTLQTIHVLPHEPKATRERSIDEALYVGDVTTGSRLLDLELLEPRLSPLQVGLDFATFVRSLQLAFLMELFELFVEHGLVVAVFDFFNARMIMNMIIMLDMFILLYLLWDDALVIDQELLAIRRELHVAMIGRLLGISRRINLMVHLDDRELILLEVFSYLVDLIDVT